MGRRRADGYVMISIISERYNIHPQTLRLYEREGLIKPARTAGNTRLYGLDEIRSATESLTQASHKLAELIYKRTVNQGQGAAGGDGAAAGGDAGGGEGASGGPKKGGDDVVDADFEEVK